MQRSRRYSLIVLGAIGLFAAILIFQSRENSSEPHGTFPIDKTGKYTMPQLKWLDGIDIADDSGELVLKVVVCLGDSVMPYEERRPLREGWKVIVNDEAKSVTLEIGKDDWVVDCSDPDGCRAYEVPGASSEKKDSSNQGASGTKSST